MQECTLVFLYKPEEKEILLAMKKRRFGEGKWNGVGGKLETNETVLESAVRETKEEISVDISKEDLNKVALLHFYFENNKEWNQVAHVFLVEKWRGEPTETEEMRPKWHPLDDLPFESMWIDDRHWLPRVLSGEKINGTFRFNENGSEVLEVRMEQW